MKWCPLHAVRRVYKEGANPLQPLRAIKVRDSLFDFHGFAGFVEKMTRFDLAGFEIYPGYLDTEAQQKILTGLRAVVAGAPLVRPVTPRGRPMSVRMTSAGAWGWVTDRHGYRYEARQPNGLPWPAIPAPVLALWHHLTGLDRAPDCLLINHYGEGARMGLHQDNDEADFQWPVVSVSLGDDGLFRMGGAARQDKTQSYWLRSGDVVVMGGKARLAFHGVDRIRFGSSRLLSGAGRLNLTLRCVT